MKRILITGCTGFLGRYLIRHLLLNPENRVSGITDESVSGIPDVHVTQVDIRDRDAVFQVIRDRNPDLVFHLAAITNVAYSWKNQSQTYNVNLLGSLHLLEALEQVNRHGRFLMMSSAEIGGATCRETPEGRQINVQSPYALSKLAMEMLGGIFSSGRGLEVIPVRAFNFTGPEQSHKFVASDFARQIARIEKGLAPGVIRVGNLEAIRDFSDVRDMARYVATAGIKGESGRLVRLGSGRMYSIRDLLDIMLRFSSKEIRVEIDPERFRPLDIPELGGDCPVLREEFKLRPEFSMEETLFDLLNWWRKRTVQETAP